MLQSHRPTTMRKLQRIWHPSYHGERPRLYPLTGNWFSRWNKTLLRILALLLGQYPLPQCRVYLLTTWGSFHSERVELASPRGIHGDALWVVSTSRCPAAALIGFAAQEKSTATSALHTLLLTFGFNPGDAMGTLMIVHWLTEVCRFHRQLDNFVGR